MVGQKQRKQGMVQWLDNVRFKIHQNPAGGQDRNFTESAPICTLLDQNRVLIYPDVQPGPDTASPAADAEFSVAKAAICFTEVLDFTGFRTLEVTAKGFFLHSSRADLWACSSTLNSFKQCDEFGFHQDSYAWFSWSETRFGDLKKVKQMVAMCMKTCTMYII